MTALGADAPEISSAVAALAAGHNDLGIGLVLGSNVFNLAGLLGVSVLVAGNVRIHRQGLALNGAVALAVTAIGAALVLGGTGAPVGGGLLAVVLVPYVVLLSVRPARVGRLLPGGVMRRSPARPSARRSTICGDERAAPASRRDVLALFAGLGAIVLGSVGMVTAATSLGSRWGISQIVVGTLVLASLTSLPNLLTAVRLALHRRGAAVVSESLSAAGGLS